MKLENGKLYKINNDGADVRQTKTIPFVRVKGQLTDFRIGVSEEFETQPTSLNDLDISTEITESGFFNSTSLCLVDYIGYNGSGIVVVKGVSLKKIN